MKGFREMFKEVCQELQEEMEISHIDQLQEDLILQCSEEKVILLAEIPCLISTQHVICEKIYWIVDIFA